MKVFITGIRGFLGSQLAAWLQAQGHMICGSTHDAAAVRASPHSPVYACNAQAEAEAVWFESCDVLIHCAYDPTPAKGEKNVAFTQQIAELAASACVPHQIFISSHSARRDACGEYGLHKYALEQYFLDRHQTILRPGLIIGPGGLFARMEKQLRNMPLILLPAPRQVPVFYIALADLLGAVGAIVLDTRRGPFNLFVPEPPSLQQFVETLLAVRHRRKPIVPIPDIMLSGILSLVDMAFDKPPAAFSRLFTARQNILNPEFHQSDLPSFGSSYTAIPEAFDFANN